MDAPNCKLCGKRHYGICPEAFRAPIRLEPHHQAWLNDHPKRDAAWLTAHLVDGFHVHHLDGDHANDSPDNLLLIDGSDHVRLHRKIMPVLHNSQAPFDRVTYQRVYMRGWRARKKARE